MGKLPNLLYLFQNGHNRHFYLAHNPCFGAIWEFFINFRAKANIKNKKIRWVVPMTQKSFLSKIFIHVDCINKLPNLSHVFLERLNFHFFLDHNNVPWKKREIFLFSIAKKANAPKLACPPRSTAEKNPFRKKNV